MAEYTININVNDDDASKKLKNLTDQTANFKKPFNIDVGAPNLDNISRGFQELGNILKIVAANASLIPGAGDKIQAIQGIAEVTTRKIEDLKRALDTAIYLSNPEQGLITYLTTATQKTNQLIDVTAKLGFTVFGIGQSVNVLKAAFGGFLDDTIGKEIRLRDTLLQVNTTLAGTNQVIKNGTIVTDVAEQIKVLEGPVRDSIENLRIKSLEISGTTSEAVISTFQVVAQNIGSFGGTLKDAENLTVKFAGALGTLGMSNPMYARQEITSLLQGNIDRNSVLATTLGISSADVAKAKQSAGGLMAYLEAKLKVFEVAQKKASFGFYGMLSNLQELKEEMQRTFGAPILDPMLNRLEKLYKPLASNAKGLTNVAGAAGQAVGSTIQGVANIVQGGPVGKAYTSENIDKATKTMEAEIAKLTIYIQEELAKLSVLLKPLLDNIQISLAAITATFYELAKTIGELKVDKFQILAKTLEVQLKVLILVVNAYSAYLNVINQILGTDLAGWVNQVTAYWQALEKIGILPLARLGYYVISLTKSIVQIVPKIISAFRAVAAFANTVLSSIAAGVSALGAFITATGIKIVVGAVTILRTIALGAAVLFRNISVGIINLATQLAQLYPALLPLLPAIARVATAFSSMAKAAQNADVQVQKAANGMVIGLQKVQVAADIAAGKIANMGQTIGAGLQKAGAAAGNFLVNTIKGLAMSAVGFIGIQVAITGIVMAIDKLKEAYDGALTYEKHRAGMAALTGGLNDQAIAAAKIGKELDKTTKSLYDYQRAAAKAVIPEMEKQITEKIAQLAALKQRNKASDKDLEQGTGGSIADFQERNSASGVIYDFLTGSGKASNIRLENTKQILKLEKEIANIRKNVDVTNKVADAAQIEKDKNDAIRLAAQANMEAIATTAKFEKQTRRGIEEQVYQYKQQQEQVLLQIEQKRSDLQIARIEEANRIVIRNAGTQAKDALQAFATFISAKKKGENEIEIKRKEAQIASANLDKEIAKMRISLEEQILEFRIKMNALDLEILDKRLQKEREIADIRNGVIVFDPANSGGGGTGNFTAAMGKGGAIITDHNDPDGQDAGKDIVVPGGIGGGVQNPFTSMKIVSTRTEGTGSGVDGKGFGKIVEGEVVQAGKTFRVFFAHLSEILVKMGDIVPGGAIIGKQGITGHATGAHTSTHVNDPDGIKVRAKGLMDQIGNFYVNGGSPIRTGNQGAYGRAASSGGGGATSSAAPSMAQNVAGYLKRLSFLESDLINQPNKQGSPGRGYFQAFPEFRDEAIKASGGKDPRSADYNEAAQAAEAWIKKFNKDAYKLMQQGNTAGADALLNRTWPSLPGGSEPQSREKLAQANKYLNPATSPDAQKTGATGKPVAQLQLTFTGVEAAVAQLENVKAALADLTEQGIKDDIGKKWTAFKEALQPSEEKLKEVNRSLDISKSELVQIGKISTETYKPEQMALYNEYLLSNTDTQMRFKTILEGIAKMEGTSAAVKKSASEEANKALKLELKQNDEIYKKKQEILEIDKLKVKITQQAADIETQRVQAIGALLEAEKSIADKRARTPKEKRRNDAEYQFKSYMNAQTKGGKEPMTDPQQIKLAEKYKEQLMETADALARFDEIAKNMQVEDMMNKWSDELMDTQGKIVGLTGTIKDEFAGAMNGAVQSVMSGNATISEAFGTMFQNIGQAFIKMATEMIAKALIMRVLGILMPGASPGGGVGPLPGFEGASSGFEAFSGSGFGIGGGGLPSFESFVGGSSFYGKKAMGGPVEANVPYLVGEVGPELFTPSGTGDITNAVDTAAAANRAASRRSMLGGGSVSSISPERGNDGAAASKAWDVTNSNVINNMISANKSSLSNSYLNQGLSNPFSDNRDTINNVTNNMKEIARDNALGTTTSVNVNYNISRINSVDYVTADEFQSGISQATAAGAKQGKQKALAALRNEPGTRRSVGMR